MGKPLHDGDHFGQTIVNDYGRPEGQGFNNVTGFSGWAVVWSAFILCPRRISAFPAAPLCRTARACHIADDFSRMAAFQPSCSADTPYLRGQSKADSLEGMWL